MTDPELIVALSNDIVEIERALIKEQEESAERIADLERKLDQVHDRSISDPSTIEALLQEQAYWGKAFQDEHTKVEALLHDKADLERRLGVARDALETINMVGVGAGADWSDAECSSYWANITQNNRFIARAALAQVEKGER